MEQRDTEIKRTSAHSKNRRNYLNQEGGYTYWRWDEESKCEIPVHLTPGEDGMTTEWVILLNSIDHDEDLGDRYEEENRDYHFENFKRAVAAGNTGDVVEEEFAGFASHKTDPVSVLFGQAKTENPEVVKLRKAMRQLTPAQLDLIYSIFGEMRTCADIAREQGVTKQAVGNRKNKILKRLKKLMEGSQL